MTEQNNRANVWKLPALGILAVVIILAMIRLGVWQLSRAAEKQSVLNQLTQRAEQAPVDLGGLDFSQTDQRFKSITVSGRLQADKTIFVDRAVAKGQVGYQVFTPLKIQGSDQSVMVSRGWVPVGLSRTQLPVIETPSEVVALSGRLNTPPAQPPLWNEKYPVSNGAVWQYLPIRQAAEQMQLKLMPLVLELPPQTAPPLGLLIEWPAIDDQWVAKHQGYAFQWFAMALAFFVACVVLLIRSSGKSKT